MARCRTSRRGCWRSASRGCRCGAPRPNAASTLAARQPSLRLRESIHPPGTRRSPTKTKGSMKLLLTSAGIKNASIHDALVELLGKPIAECDALLIPTASYGHPMGGPGGAWRFITGNQPRTPLTELGWKSMGVLELTALPSIDREQWVPLVEQTDAL